jgi:hypothetical protein
VAQFASTCILLITPPSISKVLESFICCYRAKIARHQPQSPSVTSLETSTKHALSSTQYNAPIWKWPNSIWNLFAAHMAEPKRSDAGNAQFRLEICLKNRGKKTTVLTDYPTRVPTVLNTKHDGLSRTSQNVAKYLAVVPGERHRCPQIREFLRSKTLCSAPLTLESSAGRVRVSVFFPHVTESKEKEKDECEQMSSTERSSSRTGCLIFCPPSD